MSISAADRARQNNRLTKAREEAEEREAKALKRKNEELKRAEQRHQKELKRLNDAYRTQLSSLKEKQSTKLSEQESDHQEEIADVRSSYMNQIQKKMETQNLERSEARRTYESEIDNHKNVSENQRQNLMLKQQKELEKRDKDLEVIGESTKQEMREAINDNRRRFREAHDKEIGAMQKYQSELIKQSETEKSQLKDSYGNQLDSEKRQREYENATWRLKYEDLYRQRSETGEDGDTQSQILSRELKNLRDRYDKALDSRTKKMEDGNAKFHESVNDRVNSQIKSRDSKVTNLQEKLNRHTVNDRRLRELERRNMQSHYEDKLTDLELQKNEVKESMQELTKERIAGMKKQNDDVLRQATQDYRSQGQIDRARYREHVANLEQTHLAGTERLEDRTNQKVEKIQRVADQNNQRMAEYYDTAMELTREDYSKKIVEQRDRNIELQGRNQRMMNERFRNIETSYNKKLANAVEQYESKLQQMQDDHEKEIRSLRGTSKLMLQDKEKGHKAERESLEMRYESKLAMIQEQHEQQVEKIQKRHQEDMRNLATKMNQYNRKA